MIRADSLIWKIFVAYLLLIWRDVSYLGCLGCLGTLSESGVSFFRRVADFLTFLVMICLFCWLFNTGKKDERSTKLTAHAIHVGIDTVSDPSESHLSL